MDMEKTKNNNVKSSSLLNDKIYAFEETETAGYQKVSNINDISREKIPRSPVLLLIKGQEVAERYVINKKEINIGRNPQRDIPITTDGLASRKHARIVWENYDLPDEYPRCRIEDLNSHNGTILNNRLINRPESLSDGDRFLLGSTIFGFYLKDNREMDYDNKILSMATFDSLTGLINRRVFLEGARQSIARARRYESPLCLALSDIDDFKSINDTFSHCVGDSVLREIASIMTNSMRDGDVIGRLGGDEFAILMPNSKMDDAACAIDRLHRTISNHEYLMDSRRFKVSLSTGISILSPSLNEWSLLYKAADAALYKSKEDGRNCVRIYKEQE
jgi:diguanylate cyclase (GGDEF)-like protein